MPAPALRVVHLISGDLWAGAEVATYHLLRALAERPDVRPRAIVLNRGTLVDRLRAARVPVELMLEAQHGFTSLAALVRRSVADADLVHAHRYKENLLAALSGRPWLTTQHGRPEQSSLRMRTCRALDWAATACSARRVIAVSREVETWLRRRLAHSRIRHSWNGIEDPADPGAGNAPARWPERPRRVGALGRLVRVKGFELAVRAVAACPGLELEIVGEGPERPALQQLIHACGAADRIRLVGHDPFPLARAAHWRALLVTSLHEGNPICVLEALALGVPVVSADLGGVREILAGRGGIVLPPRDPQRWASALSSLLDDRSVGAKRSLQARTRFLQAFTARAAAARIARIYAGVKAELDGSRRSE